MGSKLGFKDCGSKVQVTCPLTPGTNKSEVDVAHSVDFLKVTSRRSGKQLAHVEQFTSPVAAEHTAYQVSEDGSRLTVTLTKQDPTRGWKTLEPEESAPEPAKQPAGPAAALAERDKVSQLLQAAQAGNLQEYQQAASAFSNQDLAQVKDGNGKNSLHFAAQLGQTDLCRHLMVDHKFDVNAQDDAGETALAYAAGAGNKDTAELLLASGAEVSRSRPGGAHPVHTAAASGDKETVLLLLRHGADANADADAGPPLMWATGSRRTGAAAALLEAGADPNRLGPNDVSALLTAAATGSTDTVRALLKAGADPNLAAEQGVTPLHAAAETEQPEVVKLLLEGGANPDAQDDTGSKPIHAAAGVGDRATLDLLLPCTQPGDGEAGRWTAQGLITAARQSESAPEAVAGFPEQVDIPPAPEPDEGAAAEHKRAGDQAFVHKRYRDAVAAYTRSLQHATGNPLVWANRSVAHLRVNSPAEAFQDARRSRTLDPTYFKAWYREGCAAQALERFEDAAQAFFEAYRLQPDNAEVAQAFQHSIQLGRKLFQGAY